MNPTLSIITVVRNAPEALAETIRSVRAQTYADIEFVVVDGASTDGTTEVLRQSATLVDRWISEPDGGLYDAMNKGQRLASGDFAMFVNAGDRFVSDDAIARMARQATDRSTLYFGKVRIVDCTGRLSWEVPMLGRHGTPPRGYLPHHQSAWYPRPFYAGHEYDPAMGYRADAMYTEQAWRTLDHVFTDVTLVESTLGGISSRAIMSLAELRKEFAKETALASHIARTTGKRTQLVDVAAGAIVKYLASKIGGPALVHRLMYAKHVARHWLNTLTERS